VVLRLEGVTKRFGELVANDAIDLELRGPASAWRSWARTAPARRL
jgi:hypothetical protein